MADSLVFYQSEGSDQWRWRYSAEGNSERLANGGEEYHNLENCMTSAFRVCGLRAETSVIIAAAGVKASGPWEYPRDNAPTVVVSISR